MDEEELPDDIYASVTDLSERGNILNDAGDADAAIREWQAALAMLPEPRSRWQAALWLHASIGDRHRSKGRSEAALDAFRLAYGSADGATNPFVLFGLGASYLDLGRSKDATDCLLRTYMLDGETLFESEDPKYVNHLREQRLLD